MADINEIIKEVYKLVKKDFYLNDFIIVKSDGGKKVTILFKDSPGSSMRATNASRTLNVMYKKQGIKFGSRSVEDFYPPI